MSIDTSKRVYKGRTNRKCTISKNNTTYSWFELFTANQTAVLVRLEIPKTDNDRAGVEGGGDTTDTFT